MFFWLVKNSKATRAIGTEYAACITHTHRDSITTSTRQPTGQHQRRRRVALRNKLFNQGPLINCAVAGTVSPEAPASPRRGLGRKGKAGEKRARPAERWAGPGPHRAAAPRCTGRWRRRPKWSPAEPPWRPLLLATSPWGDRRSPTSSTPRVTPRRDAFYVISPATPPSLGEVPWAGLIGGKSSRLWVPGPCAAVLKTLPKPLGTGAGGFCEEYVVHFVFFSKMTGTFL